MKKLFFIAACVLSLAACNQDKKPAISPEQIQNDSLRAIITVSYTHLTLPTNSRV